MSKNDIELDYTMPQLLKALVDQGGSDLHISSYSPPRFRVDGELVPLEVEDLTPEHTKQLCYSILTEDQKRQVEEEYELDLAFGIKGIARFRANIYRQKGSVNGAFRVISSNMPQLEKLNLPPIIKTIIESPRGLFLVGGPTGSGKSTSLAAIINYINERRKCHIMTIEDPIEYVHQHKKALITQRELNADTKSWENALKSSLRQDPDIIMVGELRDQKTIAHAITAAETGHLVFGTLHTNSSIGALNRIIDVFPSHQQSQIRTQLSFSLIGVLTQSLLTSLRSGRVLALELMVPNTAIRSMIREDKLHNIYTAMQVGQDESGMITLNQTLLNLYRKRHISKSKAMSIAYEKNEMEEMISKYSA